MENRKIRNASPRVYNGIHFKSASEVMVYKTLTSLGFNVKYEPSKYTVWEGFKPTVPFYKPSKSRALAIDSTKVMDITYTPDFIFLAPDNKTVIIIEVKGFSNDVYPYKRKLFRAYLEDLSTTYNQPTMYFEIHTKKQLLQAIEIIKSRYEKESCNVDEGETSISS